MENTSPSSPSQDLTVVLIRGNGSPRSFRVALPALQRSILFLSILLTGSIAAALLFFGLNILRSESFTPTINSAPEKVAPAPAPAPVATSPEPSTAESAEKSGIWNKITTAATQMKPSADSSEQQKEIDGLREDIAKLHAKLEERKDIPANIENASLLQFIGPKSALVAAAESTVKVEGIKITKDPAGKEAFVNFELHNVDPSQKQARGYIVVLAKTSETIVAYPQNVFNPSQNILINFTRGETFAVSRFRQAKANFNVAQFNGKKASYQILLFGTDGRVLSSIQLEDK